MSFNEDDSTEKCCEQICQECNLPRILSQPIPLFDAHCHLQFDYLSYPSNNYKILSAIHRGLIGVVISGVCPGKDWGKIISLYKLYPSFIVPQFGLHPWYIKEFFSTNANNNIKWLQTLEKLLETYPCAGVGECGLDRPTKKAVPLIEQVSILSSHLSIAEKYSRTITVHCVGAWGTLYELCRDRGTALPPVIVLHSCSNMPVSFIPLFLALPALLYFSFTARPGGSLGGQMAAAVPLHRLLLETDAGANPFDYSDLLAGAVSLAQLRHISVEEIMLVTVANSRDAFVQLKHT